ncbi:MAG TPA: exodeoxyribonuclease VII small subunit [Chitinophagaceae bacterium]
MKQAMTYEAAYTELKQISDEIQSEEVTVDELAEKVKRAAELIQFCQQKLRSTEEEVNRIIEGMGAKGTPVQ